MSAGSKRENFYRRNPSDALAGMMGMTLEERGVYNTVIDLLYSTWRPVEDSRSFIAGWCGCAVQKLNPIIDRLIARKKLIRFEEDGCFYLSNQRFEAERSDVKGSQNTRSGRGKSTEKSGEVGEKSASVEEKSAGVEENPPVLDTDVEENQPVTALEKSREDKTRVIERARKRTPIPDDWEPRAAEIEFAAKHGFGPEGVEREAVKFKAHHTAAGKTMANWSAAWRTWVMNAEEWRKARTPEPVRKVTGALV